jgi:hypothetical protein
LSCGRQSLVLIWQFIKNVTLSDNIIFNTGVPFNKHVDNLIIASQDADGINVAKNIQVLDNVFYHNVDFSDYNNFGHGPSLTLGYTSKSPSEDISILNHVIIGKNNALNMYHAKSVIFKNNQIYAGYIHFEVSTLAALEAGRLKLDNNRYFTRRNYGFRIAKHKDYRLKDWQDNFNIDKNSQLKQLKDFEINPVL